jgi:UDP-N-acetyl-D-galactosamine dehydrogenase
MNETIGVLGLGYVGLPLALALARKFPGTVGFDINADRVALLKKGVDVTREGFDVEVQETTLAFTAEPSELKRCTFLIVAVPTPVDENRAPDLEPLLKACALIGPILKRGAVVVFESTVYPGVTEDICGPALERASGLLSGQDFTLGYSPERINPGDKEHTLERIVKVVAGQDTETADRVAAVYGAVVTAGVFRATSIKVAEAAKVIENTQRDLNIALMNELAIIFDRLGISSRDVLEAAGTKWNFLRFTPGLVGGHCIGVDPYYLTMRAQQVGYHPKVILAGRRINDGMGVFVAQRLVKLMVQAGLQIKGARVGVLGITFKENVSDLRNSRVPDIIRELVQFGAECLPNDPMADREEAHEEYGFHTLPLTELSGLDAVIVAVSHEQYRALGASGIRSLLRPGGVVVDIKGVFRPADFEPGYHYWSL